VIAKIPITLTNQLQNVSNVNQDVLPVRTVIFVLIAIRIIFYHQQCAFAVVNNVNSALLLLVAQFVI
jgi:hypothetical protein